MKAALLLLSAVVSLSSCTKEDEELQRQIIELRATVEAKNRTVEQLESQVAGLKRQGQASGGSATSASSTSTATPSAPSASSAELASAKARITELEQRLATASATPAAAPLGGKLDLDDIAIKLEEDLTRKAKQLRELVQRQSPSSRIDEISLKSIEYPPQLITPFNSAITFTVTEGTGTPMRLMFPVSADLGGSWTLPTPDEIQKAYRAAIEQPRNTASTGTAASGTGRQQLQRNTQAQSQPATASGGGARMTQRADGVFVFDWGDGTSAAQQPQQQRQASSPAASPQPAAPQQPSVAPRTPSPSPPPAAVPPPIMPIVGDRVIRFND